MKLLKYSVLILVLALLGGLAALWSWPEAIQYIPFMSKQDDLRLTGVVETQEIRLGSKIGGRIEKLYVNEGDLIKPDQVLIRIAIPEMEAKRTQAAARALAAKAAYEKAERGPLEEEKRAAEASMLAAKARLDRLTAGWRKQEQLQYVSELEAAQAELKQTQAEFERVEQVWRENRAAISQSEYDLVKANRDRAQSKVKAAQAKVEMVVREGSRKEDIDEAQADLKKYEAQFELLKRGTREEDRALAKANLLEAEGSLKELETNCAEAEVKSPAIAVVEIISVRPGDLVMPNQPILRVLKLDDIWVKVFVPEVQLGKVKKGQAVDVKIDSHPGRLFKGIISYIANESEFLPRNVQSADERRNQVFAVKVVIQDEDSTKIFKPKMFAEVKLRLE